MAGCCGLEGVMRFPSMVKSGEGGRNAVCSAVKDEDSGWRCHVRRLSLQHLKRQSKNKVLCRLPCALCNALSRENLYLY